MNVESHLDQLRLKHEGLKAAIREQERQPSVDHLTVMALKKKKLHIKDEINRLEHANH
ncbi:MAG: YdcH family protein [Pseudomonadota bacterium]